MTTMSTKKKYNAEFHCPMDEYGSDGRVRLHVLADSREEAIDLAYDETCGRGCQHCQIDEVCRDEYCEECDRPLEDDANKCHNCNWLDFN